MHSISIIYYFMLKLKIVGEWVCLECTHGNSSHDKICEGCNSARPTTTSTTPHKTPTQAEVNKSVDRMLAGCCTNNFGFANVFVF